MWCRWFKIKSRIGCSMLDFISLCKIYPKLLTAEVFSTHAFRYHSLQIRRFSRSLIYLSHRVDNLQSLQVVFKNYQTIQIPNSNSQKIIYKHWSIFMMHNISKSNVKMTQLEKRRHNLLNSLKLLFQFDISWCFDSDFL